MIKALKQIAFLGSILIAVLGIILILIVNDAKYEPKLLVQSIKLLVFVCGLSIFIVVLKKGLKG